MADALSRILEAVGVSGITTTESPTESTESTDSLYNQKLYCVQKNPRTIQIGGSEVDTILLQ